MNTTLRHLELFVRCWPALGEQHDNICPLGRKRCLFRGEGAIRNEDRGRGASEAVAEVSQVRNAS